MLKKIFNIRIGEEVRAFLMLTYIFLIISSLMIIKPVSHAQFLSQFGARQLPFVFILVAGFAAVVSTFYGKILRQKDFLKLIRQTLYIFLGLLLIIWIFLRLRFGEGVILYVFFIAVSIFAVIATSQFWILANIVFNPREAKRLFGFIGAGAIAGGILGGYITKFMVPLVGSENLILIGAFLLLWCDPIVKRIWKENPAYREVMQAGRQSGLFEKTNVPLKMIRSNRHLFFLASIVILSVAVSKFIDYEFNAMASERIKDEEQLTAFLGFWYSNLNVISLLIQLFITRQVVGVFGVGTSLLFLPLTILLGSAAILIHPALWSAIFLKVGDGSLKNSVQKSGIELLSLPIPAEIRNPARSFIDVFGDSFATGVSGLLLMIITVIFNVPVRYVSLVILTGVGVWLYYVKRVRQEYIHTVRGKIEIEARGNHKTDIDVKNESVIGSLTKILSGKQETRIINVLKNIREIQNDRLVPSLEKLIHHPSITIKTEALRNLYFYTQDFSNEISPYVFNENFELQTEALHYLFRHEENQIDLLQRYLDHPDERIRYAALLCAARESRNNETLKDIFRIRERIESCLKRLKKFSSNEGETEKSVCAQMIGIARIPDLFPFLHILLRETSPVVIKSALLAAGQTKDRTFLPVLMRRLMDSHYQKCVLEALSFFDTDIIGLFVRWMTDAKEERAVRLNLPQIIANTGTQRAAEALVEHLETEDEEIRHKIINALNYLRKHYPKLNFNNKRIVNRILEEARLYTQTLAVLYAQIQNKPLKYTDQNLIKKEVHLIRKRLIRALEKKLDQTLEIIFKLLGLKYPPDDIESAFTGVRSKQPEIRMNAVEFLDNLLDGHIKRIIIPIVESALMENLVERTLKQFGLPVPSEYECFTTLLEGEDDHLKSITLSLIEVLKTKQYTPQVCALLNQKNPNIQRQAECILKRIGIM